ncbi:MAG: MupG family TIM beta-alpha barrel fold protein [Oscillospiraceae bacterium]
MGQNRRSRFPLPAHQRGIRAGLLPTGEAVCQWLFEAGFSILADVSVKTRQQFGEPDLIRLAKRLHIWALRIDYGLSQEEILSLAGKCPLF